MPFDVDTLLQTDLSIAPVTGIIQPTQFSPFPTEFRGPNIIQSIENYQKDQNQMVQLQFPSDRPKFFFTIALANYSRNGVQTITPNLNTTDVIILPVPLSIMDSQQIVYEDYTFGVLAGNALNVGMDKMGGTNGNAPSQVNAKEALGGAAAITGVNMASGAASGLTGRAIPADAGVKAVEAFTGLAPNQFTTILLKSPSFKRLSFEWHLVPRSFAESRTLRDIIRTLNNASAPGLALSGALFTFPQICRCAFMPNFNYLFRMKPMVIESVTWDYSPGQGPVFYHLTSDDATGHDYAPESIKMRLNMQELEYWLHGDYKGDDADAFDTTASAAERSAGSTIASAEDALKRVTSAAKVVGNIISNTPTSGNQQN